MLEQEHPSNREIKIRSLDSVDKVLLATGVVGVSGMGVGMITAAIAAFEGSRDVFEPAAFAATLSLWLFSVGFLGQSIRYAIAENSANQLPPNNY